MTSHTAERSTALRSLLYSFVRRQRPGRADDAAFAAAAVSPVLSAAIRSGRSSFSSSSSSPSALWRGVSSPSATATAAAAVICAAHLFLFSRPLREMRCAPPVRIVSVRCAAAPVSASGVHSKHTLRWSAARCAPLTHRSRLSYCTALYCIVQCCIVLYVRLTPAQY